MATVLQSTVDKGRQHVSMMQGACQRSSSPHISTGDEEHIVPRLKENCQDDKKYGRNKKKKRSGGGNVKYGPQERNYFSKVVQ